MRKRLRESTHQIIVYKFRCYLRDENAATGHLPDAIYEFVKRQQDVWNAFATEQERRWNEWKSTHPQASGPNAPAFQKPSREWWAGWEAWMRHRLSEAHLGWEAESDIIERFSATLRRMSKNGGSPRIQHRLRSFSIPHRYTGGGIRIDKLSGKRAERLRINFPSSTVYLKNDRESRRNRVVNASFRVGEANVGMRLVLHREIPPDAIIKCVRLIGRKQSPTMNWETYLAITVEIPFVQPTTKPTLNIIGIDVGWRLVGDQVRVAVAYDGRRHHELLLPLTFTQRRLGAVSFDRRRLCQQLCDAALERCKVELKTLGLAVPVQARNGFLMQMLRDEHTASEARPILERWKRDNDALRRKVLMLENAMTRRRDHIYREWSAEIASTNDIIRVEDLNLPEMYDFLASEEPKAAVYALWMSRERRKLASVGLLISMVSNAARMRGKTFEKSAAAWTTRTCSRCGGYFEVEGPKLVGKCQSCGRVADQDWNAAENIFANLPPSQTSTEAGGIQG